MKTGTARGFLRLGRPQLGSPPDAGFEALSGKTESNEKKMSAYSSDLERFVERTTPINYWPV
jgi:hypothetical protein